MDDIKEAINVLFDGIVNIDTDVYKNDLEVAKFITFAIENNILNFDKTCAEGFFKEKVVQFIEDVDCIFSQCQLDICSRQDFFKYADMTNFDFNFFNISKYVFPLKNIAVLFNKTHEDSMDALHKNFLMFFFISINTIYEDLDQCCESIGNHYRILLEFFEGDAFTSDSLSCNIIDFCKILNDELHETKNDNIVYDCFEKVLCNPELPEIMDNLIKGVLLCSSVEDVDKYVSEVNEEICQYEKSSIKKYVEMAKTKLQSEEVKQLLDLLSNFQDMDINKLSSLMNIASNLDMNNLSLDSITGLLSNVAVEE